MRRAVVAIALFAAIPAGAGNISAPGLKDRAVTLYRCGPFGAASGEIEVPFVNAGAGTAGGIRITPDVVSSDLAAANVPPRVVDGRIIITVPSSFPHGSTAAKLTFSGFRDAGVFQTRLFVATSPSGPLDEVPFKIVVTDRIPFPLLAIILGVLLGVAVNLIATRFRPAEDVRARAFALAAAVMSLRERSGDAVSETLTQGVLDELMRIARAAITEDAASLRARLDILRLQVDAMSSAANAAIASVYDRRNAIAVALEALPRETAQKLAARLAKLDELIAAKRFSMAKEAAAELTKEIAVMPVAAAAAIPDFVTREKVARSHVFYADITLAVVALFVSVITGIWVLWAGKVFGTAAQYIEAFVWGFGIDSSVRGFGAVMKRLTGP